MVVLVLEGAAKGGQPVGADGAIHTVHAPGSGDDTIVEQVHARRTEGDDVVVVTADRVLRERVAAAGGSSVGPSWLLSRTSCPSVGAARMPGCPKRHGSPPTRPVRSALTPGTTSPDSSRRTTASGVVAGAWAFIPRGSARTAPPPRTAKPSTTMCGREPSTRSSS